MTGQWGGGVGVGHLMLYVAGPNFSGGGGGGGWEGGGT